MGDVYEMSLRVKFLGRFYEMSFLVKFSGRVYRSSFWAEYIRRVYDTRLLVEFRFNFSTDFIDQFYKLCFTCRIGRQSYLTWMNLRVDF